MPPILCTLLSKLHNKFGLKLHFLSLAWRHVKGKKKNPPRKENSVTFWTRRAARVRVYKVYIHRLKRVSFSQRCISKSVNLRFSFQSPSRRRKMFWLRPDFCLSLGLGNNSHGFQSCLSGQRVSELRLCIYVRWSFFIQVSRSSYYFFPLPRTYIHGWLTNIWALSAVRSLEGLWVASSSSFQHYRANVLGKKNPKAQRQEINTPARWRSRALQYVHIHYY